LKDRSRKEEKAGKEKGKKSARKRSKEKEKGRKGRRKREDEVLGRKTE
jgi:hypothetical protein